MSARRLANNHVLPANPSWLEFPRSDGDETHLPKNTQRTVDNEGCVNFMRPVDLDESTAVNWRVLIGAQLAKKMNLAEGPTYVLKSFPEGYRLFDHNKGPATSPRHDPYLCGSRNVNRFRSTNEFIPHALWLMQDATLNRANCECKYCAKKPQRLVSDALELPSNRRFSGTPMSTPPRAPRRHREVRVARRNPYTAVRRAPKPVKQLTGPKQALAPERDCDIRAALVGDEYKIRRRFREGELVWCALNPPIHGETEAESIHFWPGIVDDVHVKSEAVPRLPEEGGNKSQDVAADLTALYEQDSDGELAPSRQSQEASMRAADDQKVEVPWTVRQWNVYTVKLLAVSHEYVVADHQVLPYLAYAPADDLLRHVQEELLLLLHEVPIPNMDSDLAKIFPFNPVLSVEYEGPSSSTFNANRFRQAVAPFTLAVQIAANVARYWSPTHEWECKYTIPSPDIVPPPATSEPGPPPVSEPAPSLHTLITQSMANNAAASSLAASTQEPARASDDFYHPEGMSAEDVEALKARVMGRVLRPTAVVNTVTQPRFQGLWWGAERIWTDELVRLKLARRQFAPQGTDIVYPPSGAAVSTIAHAENIGYTSAEDKADNDLLGSAEKGLFLRLEGLFVVEVPKEDGNMTRECRASGTVYELADEDWEDRVNAERQGPATASREEVQQVVENGNGKGKERAHDVGLSALPSNGPPSGSISAPPGSTSTSKDVPNESDQMDVDGAASFPSVSQGVTGPSFMPGPSPLKPPPLPNPDPSVPIQETAAATLTESLPQNKKPQKPTLGAQLSHPVLATPYPLPEPPKGFKFRPIHPPGHEVVMSLTLISGRYYPGLLSHPLMVPTVERALEVPPDEGGFFANRHLWAMEGLLPGTYQSMEPAVWQPGRASTFKDADEEARARFHELWEQCKQEREQMQSQALESPTRRHEVIDVDMLTF